MFALLGSRLTVVVLVIAALAGAAAYVKLTLDKISSLKVEVALLNQQEEAMKAAAAQMQRDIAAVVEAQTRAQIAIAQAKQQAQSKVSAIQAESLAKVPAGTLQQKVNDDTAAALKRLEDLTRAP